MKKIDYAIVFVSDMQRSVAFYRDVVGYPLRFESPGWTEFATEGTTLALHLQGETPAGVCLPGVSVEDLDAFHADVTAKGVRCVKPPRQQESIRLAQYADPDGLTFSVSERPHHN